MFFFVFFKIFVGGGRCPSKVWNYCHLCQNFVKISPLQES